MDQLEEEYLQKEDNDLLSCRLRMARFGDPRRYSMWFARAWAWRHVQNLMSTQGVKLDNFFFVRPDLFWFLPVPSKTFFDTFQQSDREAWFHDTYFSYIPDTIAYLPNAHVANDYFSLKPLLEPGIFCLGGPNLNQTITKQKLDKINMTSIAEPFWCQEEEPRSAQGWSEHILQRKIQNSVQLHDRTFPAAVNILRPLPHKRLVCLPRRFVSPAVQYARSPVPQLPCLVAELLLQAYCSPLPKQVEWVLSHIRPIRIRDTHDPTMCLTANHGTGTLTPQPCKENSMSPFQLFVQRPKLQHNPSLRVCKARRLLLPLAGTNETRLASSVILDATTMDEKEDHLRTTMLISFHASTSEERLVLFEWNWTDHTSRNESVWVQEESPLYSSSTFRPKRGWPLFTQSPHK